jgi:hypothetical protein
MQPLLARRATGEDGSTLAVFLAARADGAPVWLLLDSGNLVGTILSPHAVEQIGLPLPPAADDEKAMVLEAATVEVLGVASTRESIVVRDLIHDGALGASFMKRGIVMFDLRMKEPWVGIQETGVDRGA